MFNQVRLSDALCPDNLDTNNFFANKEIDYQYNVSMIAVKKCNNLTSPVKCRSQSVID